MKEKINNLKHDQLTKTFNAIIKQCRERKHIVKTGAL